MCACMWMYQDKFIGKELFEGKTHFEPVFIRWEGNDGWENDAGK